jgi:hypothetical protein
VNLFFRPDVAKQLDVSTLKSPQRKISAICTTNNNTSTTMGLTAKELFGYVFSFSVIHAIYNFISMIAIFERDERTVGWCTQSNSFVRFKLSGFTGPLLFFSFASSIWTIVASSKGTNNSNAKLLRQGQYAALATLFMASWGLIGLYYDVGVLNGRIMELVSLYSNSYCQASTPLAADAVTAGWIILLLVQSALYIISKTLIRNLDPEAVDISIFDLGLHATQKLVSFVRRGRKGVRNTVVYAKKFVQTSIRVKTQHDDIFREVTFSTAMMRCYTLQELKESISDRFGMPVNDIRCLLKNGNVVVENDEDVARLTSGDYIDVVFGNARPFEHMPDLVPAFMPVVPRPYEPLPAYAPFNASLSQIV